MVENKGFEPFCIRIASAMITPSNPIPRALHLVFTLLKIREKWNVDKKKENLTVDCFNNDKTSTDNLKYVSGVLLYVENCTCLTAIL